MGEIFFGEGVVNILVQGKFCLTDLTGFFEKVMKHWFGDMRQRVMVF